MRADASITLVIGGAAYSTWTRVELDADFLSPADAWAAEVKNPDTASLASIAAGSPVTILINGDLAMVGTLDRTEVTRTMDGGLGIALSGRDAAGPLVDCSPGPGWVWRNRTLEGVATQACSEVSPAVVVIADAEARTQLPVIKAEAGETYWAALSRYARKLGLLVWMEPDGTLRLGRPNYDSDPVGQLIHGLGARRGDSNVLDMSFTHDITGRFSALRVLGQAPGSSSSAGDGKLSGSAEDGELVAAGINRPGVLDEGEVRSTRQAKARAALEVGRRIFEARTLRYTVAGTGPRRGEIWTPDTQVAVRDDVLGIDAVWWLAGRRIVRDTSGTRSTLTLKPRNLLDAPEAL